MGLSRLREKGRRLRFFFAITLFLIVGGCAHPRPRTTRGPAPPPAPAPSPAPPRTPARPPAPGSLLEEGQASWYGVPYHGRRAANGEIYDMYKLTAAHRTLPFETIVRVTNLKNGRQIEVRITDRGPFVENRIIDLSLAAARELDMVAAGLAPVRLEFISGANPVAGYFTVQVGAFLARENAERLRAQLEERYQPVFIQEYDSPTGLFHRVRVGRVPSMDAAKQLADRLRTDEGFVPFVVRLDE
jgi:peptidoglycan lytic transglycosylase